MKHSELVQRFERLRVKQKNIKFSLIKLLSIYLIMFISRSWIIHPHSTSSQMTFTFNLISCLWSPGKKKGGGIHTHTYPIPLLPQNIISSFAFLFYTSISSDPLCDIYIWSLSVTWRPGLDQDSVTRSRSCRVYVASSYYCKLHSFTCIDYCQNTSPKQTLVSLRSFQLKLWELKLSI